MELLIAVLQVVLLFVGVALALWWALRRLLTEQLLEQMQSVDFDFVIREYPAPANDFATDQIAVVSAALGDGTAAIGDVRFGGRAGCAVSGTGGGVRMTVGAAIVLQSRVLPSAPVQVVQNAGAAACADAGDYASFSFTTVQAALAPGVIALSTAEVVLIRGDARETFRLASGTATLYNRFVIDRNVPERRFAYGTFEMMLRSTGPNTRRVMFVAYGRFGLRTVI